MERIDALKLHVETSQFNNFSTYACISFIRCLVIANIIGDTLGEAKITISLHVICTETFCNSLPFITVGKGSQVSAGSRKINKLDYYRTKDVVERNMQDISKCKSGTSLY